MKRFFIFAFCLFTSYYAHAQQFGGNPASLRWQQINTDTARIIFPKGMQAAAQRVASIIHELQKNHTNRLGDSLHKINIVLQPQTLISNGYVSLAPFRSEFYLTPPQNNFELGAVKWADNLAIHEFRHVQQYNHFKRGLSRVASFIAGEQGRAVANAAAIPDWFFEGDAVFNETRFSKQGRGALPLFLSNYQSLFNSGKQYSYMQMRNGSLRHFVPDHYALGYLLVAYGREKYGDDIWQKISADAAAFKPLFYPFQGALKKYTGIPFNRFVQDAMQFYRQQWTKIPADSVNWITQTDEHSVQNYQYPYAAGNDAVIVLKTSQKSIPAFYRVDADGSEKRISAKDISNETYFSYNNGRIIYAAYEPDPRYGNRDFHSIRILDIYSGKEEKILSRTKYFSPDISHNGNMVAAVSTVGDSAKLELIHIENNTRKVLASGTGKVYTYPKFSANDEYIYTASSNEKGEMGLLRFHTADSRVETLLPFSNRIIGFLQVQGDTLLFSTTYAGRDEIWAITGGNAIHGPFRLASFSTGIYQACLGKKGVLIGAAFTADGYRLGRFQTLWQRTEWTEALSDLYVNKAFPAGEHEFLNQLAVSEFPESPYPKLSHPFNFHSFRPWYEQPEYSLTLYGQNILNTIQTEITYTYNQNEGSYKLGFNGIYGGGFLQPLFGISQTIDRSALLNKDTILNWDERVAYAGLQLPLNLTGGKQYRYLNLYSTFNTENINWTGLAQKLFDNRNVQYLNSRISYASQIQKSVQQIYPHWGQNLLLQYKTATNRYTAHQLLGNLSVYLPGLSANHSIVLGASYQTRDTLLQYLFSNSFPFARGYQAVDFPQMWRIGANYHFPLAFPDWGFGNIVYFLRVRANLFYDYTEGKSLRTGIRYPFQTMGTELFFDTRWWNQQPVTFGVRYSRLINNEFRGATQPDIWEFIMPVNLFN